MQLHRLIISIIRYDYFLWERVETEIGLAHHYERRKVHQLEFSQSMSQTQEEQLYLLIQSYGKKN